MSDQFLGEIRIFAGNFQPADWAFCNGQLLPIAHYSALFALLGTAYGGDGTTTFALPNLQGALPIGQGQAPGLTTRENGDVGGEAQVILQQTELPAHTHTVNASSDASTASDPTNAVWAVGGQTRGGVPLYSADTNPIAPMNTGAIWPEGNNTPHNNMSPILALSFIIALQGIDPHAL